MPRRKKPTNLHVLHGTLRKHRANPDEPQPELSRDMPAPGWLDEDARDEWKRIAPELEEIGVLAHLDSEMLGCYCTAVSLRNQALKDIDENGVTLIATNRDGAIVRKKNPACQVLKESFDTMRAFGSMFGLHPSARTSLNAAPPRRHMTSEERRKHELAKRLFKPT